MFEKSEAVKYDDIMSFVHFLNGSIFWNYQISRKIIPVLQKKKEFINLTH